MPKKVSKIAAVPPPNPIAAAEPKRSSGRNLQLQIGLITLPIKLHTGARAERISFRTLHTTCLTALKQQAMTCPTCDEDVASDETVKGFEFRKNEFAVVTKDEIEAQRPDTSTTIEVNTFVDAGDVDPIYFETSHFIAPGDGGARPFLLIRDVLRNTGKVGIGRATFGNSEHVVLIRPYRLGLALHTLFYESEVRGMSFPVDQLTLTPAEIKLGTQMVENMTDEFNIAQFSDSYATNIKALVAAKMAGTAPKMPVRKPSPAQPDLMAALTASVAASSKPKAKKAA